MNPSRPRVLRRVRRGRGTPADIVRRTVVLPSLILLVGMLRAAGPVNAQPAPQPPETMPLASVTPLSAAQLDQLTAPIALYPDPLLGQILAAATYPLEIVEAARWLKDPAHTALKGSELAAALEPLSWDQSVKSLVPFPDVLSNLNSNLEWTEQLGDAFLAQQADVMDSIQRLRQRAAAAGSLRSTPQEIVTNQDNEITIEPANPDVVYVPYYVPAEVFAPWPWPEYEPYFWAAPPGIVYGAGLIWFGIGFPVIEPYWGWWGWNWPGHGFVVYPQPLHYPRHGPVVRPRPDGEPAKPWQHDPFHRRGVPYRNVATATRYLGPQGGWARPYRGYPVSPAVQPQRPEAASPARGPEQPGVPSAPRPQPTPYVQPLPRMGPAPRAPVSRPAAPAFESFGRGPQVRGEAARGSSSFSAPPASHGASPGHR